MEHETTNQYSNDNSKAPTIFPLSPDPALEKTEKLPQLHTYRKYLQAAFSEPRIANIAVTGGFGIGKSSIVRSLEPSLRKKAAGNGSDSHTAGNADCQICKKIKKNSCEGSGFLYISLGSFASAPDHAENGKDKQREEKKNDSQELNSIERRLLLQIYARFHRRDIPLSSFRLIPEGPRKQRTIAALCGLITCAVLLLLFHEMLGHLLVVLSADCSVQPIRAVLEAMVSFKPYLHLFLYLFLIAAASFAAAMVCLRALPRLRLSVALKANHAEVALEKEACESYLDLYSMELVYCLEQLVDRIDGTVVFEDFDRLPSNVYVQIFTRLREINYMTNLRLKAKKKRIRFIYVINDSLLGDIIHPKFFDYILPVIPYLNQKSSETILIKRMKAINEAAGFGESSSRNIEQVVFQVAPYLADFRLQNTVLNEYSLLSELYKAHGAEHPDDYDAARLFAFAIYKNVWPDDYQNLLLGKSRVFGGTELQCPDDMEHYDLLKLLTDPDNPLLTSHCLYYAGFRELDVANMRRSRWEYARSKEIIRDIDTIQPAEHHNLDLVRNHCTGILEKEYRDCINYINVVAAAIRCMVRCGQTDNSWFFNKGTLKSRLHILAEMEDESVKSRFFELTAASSKENIYGVSSITISELHEITKAELVELCRGIKQFTGDISLRVDGALAELKEDNSVVKQARTELKG